MNRLPLFTLVFAVTACSSNNNVLVGERSDGLTVYCEDVGDEVYECEPEDGDDECESYEDGGAAFVMWPPNHKMVAFSIADCLAIQACADPAPADPSTDPLDPADWTVTAVTADEAVDVGAGGDGKTADFDVVIGADGVELRSERQGGGDGRVYTIELENDLGDVITCEAHVPHDQGPFGGAVDSGEVVRVTP